jgi:hypothetical protein
MQMVLELQVLRTQWSGKLVTPETRVLVHQHDTHINKENES